MPPPAPSSWAWTARRRAWRLTSCRRCGWRPRTRTWRRRCPGGRARRRSGLLDGRGCLLDGRGCLLDGGGGLLDGGGGELVVRVGGGADDQRDRDERRRELGPAEGDAIGDGLGSVGGSGDDHLAAGGRRLPRAGRGRRHCQRTRRRKPTWQQRGERRASRVPIGCREVGLGGRRVSTSRAFGFARTVTSRERRARRSNACVVMAPEFGGG